MQLGTWIEFDTIVGKERTASGTQPIVRAMNHPRRGLVIGSRLVYDVQLGTPPLLTNSRKVLLVAVSLHRCYRVFPHDARPTTPPQPRRRIVQAAPPATGATVPLAPMSASFPAPRSPIAPYDLEALVAQEINRRIARAESFTAYDLTLALRATNPHVEISHVIVRRAVHAQMAAIVASRLYEREPVRFGPSGAQQYVPV